MGALVLDMDTSVLVAGAILLDITSGSDGKTSVVDLGKYFSANILMIKFQ